MALLYFNFSPADIIFMSSWRQIARIKSVAYTVAVPEIVPTIAIVHKAVFLGSFTREADTDLDITQAVGIGE